MFGRLLKYFYEQNKHDQGVVKQLAMKIYNKSKNLEIVYACLKEFGVNNNLCHQLHRLVVQTSLEKHIVKDALKFYHDQSIHDSLYKEPQENFWKILCKTIYEQSPLTMAKLVVIEDDVDVIDRGLKMFYEDASGNFVTNAAILRAKKYFALKDKVKALEELQQALLSMPDDDVIKAVYSMEVKHIYYESRHISVPKSIYTDKLQSSAFIKLIRGCEKHIGTLDDPLEQAFLYIDFVAAVDHPVMITNCYLMACAYLNEYSQRVDA